MKIVYILVFFTTKFLLLCHKKQAEGVSQILEILNCSCPAPRTDSNSNLEKVSSHRVNHYFLRRNEPYFHVRNVSKNRIKIAWTLYVLTYLLLFYQILAEASRSSTPSRNPLDSLNININKLLKRYWAQTYQNQKSDAELCSLA